MGPFPARAARDRRARFGPRAGAHRAAVGRRRRATVRRVRRGRAPGSGWRPVRGDPAAVPGGRGSLRGGRPRRQGAHRRGRAIHVAICAFAAEASDPTPPARDPFTVVEAPGAAESLAVRRLADIIGEAVHHGPVGSNGAPADFPVVIARPVLAEAAAAASAAGDHETGGVLLGRLSRDKASGELIVEVTAQIPAREAIADDVSLRFTPARGGRCTARSPPPRRRADPGLAHATPQRVAVPNCPPERRSACRSNTRSSRPWTWRSTARRFSARINIALLLSFHDDPAPRFDLFGWRQRDRRAAATTFPRNAHDG